VLTKVGSDTGGIEYCGGKYQVLIPIPVLCWFQYQCSVAVGTNC